MCLYIFFGVFGCAALEKLVTVIVVMEKVVKF